MPKLFPSAMVGPSFRIEYVLSCWLGSSCCWVPEDQMPPLSDAVEG